jgi:hypothetical protein
VYAIKANGVQMFDRTLTLDGSLGIKLFSCAVSKAGSLAVSGGAYDRSGQATTFLAFLNASGETVRIQRLSNFVASRLHYDDQHNLWAVGSVPGATRKAGDAMDVFVRVFSSDGATMLNVTVPYASIEGRPGPAIGSFLSSTAGGKALTILSPHWQELLVVEFANGNVKRHRYDNPPGFDMITGAAMSNAGELFMSVQHRVSPKSGHHYALYKWNQKTGMWDEVVLGAGKPEGQFSILGVEGNRFLVRVKGQFVWMPVPPATTAGSKQGDTQ